MATMSKTQNWGEVAERPDGGGGKLYPKGPQNIIIVSNVEKDTSNSFPDGRKGRMIEIAMMIEGGEFGGDVIYERLNWDCAPNTKQGTVSMADAVKNAEQAEKIAEKTASNMAKALGIVNFSGDIDAFNNRRCIVDIDQTPPKGNYGPGNRFRYRALGTVAPAGASGSALPAGFGQQAAPAVAAATSAPVVNPFAGQKA